MTEAFTESLAVCRKRMPRLTASSPRSRNRTTISRDGMLWSPISSRTLRRTFPRSSRGRYARIGRRDPSMTQELKVTKAPTKTLGALVRFATLRYRKVVILFDRFDMWPASRTICS